jgi:hypothetical protein
MSGTMKPSRKALAAAGIGVAVVLVAVGTTLTLTPATGGASGGKPSAQYLASARTALVRYLQHNDAPASHAPLPSGGSGFGTLRPINTSGSYNWSGYVDTDATAGYFKSISGDWTTPTVGASCTIEDTVAAQWIGLDGWTNKTVEQEGVIDWCFEDHATYYTWYEMYPAGSVEVGKTLQPGDKIATSITTSVAKGVTSYKMVLTDSTRTGNGFNKTLTCPAATCKDTSAEWIDERPDFTTSGFAPLADFGTWTLSGASVKGGTVSGTAINAYGDSAIEMIDSTGSYLLATPSALATHDRGFTVKWDDSY